MIKATLEAGIPIDHIAGVSIGAFVSYTIQVLIEKKKSDVCLPFYTKSLCLHFLFWFFQVGGLYANERNFAELTRKARTFSSKMVQYWRQALGELETIKIVCLHFFFQ